MRLISTNNRDKTIYGSLSVLTHPGTPGTATGLENVTVRRAAVEPPVSSGGRVDTRTTAGQLDPGRYTVTAV